MDKNFRKKKRKKLNKFEILNKKSNENEKKKIDSKIKETVLKKKINKKSATEN